VLNISDISIALTPYCCENGGACPLEIMHGTEAGNCPLKDMSHRHKDCAHQENHSRHKDIPQEHNRDYSDESDSARCDMCACEHYIVEKEIPYNDVNTQKLLFLILTVANPKIENTHSPFLDLEVESFQYTLHNWTNVRPSKPLYIQISSLLI